MGVRMHVLSTDKDKIHGKSKKRVQIGSQIEFVTHFTHKTTYHAVPGTGIKSRLLGV